jgi:hypothetical protein
MLGDERGAGAVVRLVRDCMPGSDGQQQGQEGLIVKWATEPLATHGRERDPVAPDE